MKAAVVAIGSELLGVDRLDTNSLFLTGILRRFGVDLRVKTVVGDSVDDIVGSLRRFSDDVDLVLVTGGLGPTADDVTRDAVASAFSRSLEHHEEIVRVMQERFGRAGIRMAQVNRRQAQVPRGSHVLDNERGTAPGLRIDEEESTIFVFPGVPHELHAMAQRCLEPWLAVRMPGVEVEQRVLRVSCVPESALEERIAPAYDDFGRESITVLARPGDIEIRASATGDEETRRRVLDAMVERLADLIGDAVYSRGADDSLEATVGRRARSGSWRLSTAESCTGGLVSQRLTSVPGSSSFFVGGAVAYSNALKSQLLGVDEGLLEEHGAVSPAVARAMAQGANERFGSDYALSITGIAGPDGGSDQKPVGTVHIAIASPEGRVVDEHRRFPGDRDRVRTMSAQWALEMLRRRLYGLELPG